LDIYPEVGARLAVPYAFRDSKSSENTETDLDKRRGGFETRPSILSV